MKVWASRKGKDEICLGVDNILDDNADRASCTLQRAKPLEFETAMLYETDDKLAMCTITESQASELLSDLIKIGVKPT